MTDAFEIYVATIEEINNLFDEMLVYAANTKPTDEIIKRKMIGYADKVYDIAYNAKTGNSVMDAFLKSVITISRTSYDMEHTTTNVKFVDSNSYTVWYNMLTKSTILAVKYILISSYDVSILSQPMDAGYTVYDYMIATLRYGYNYATIEYGMIQNMFQQRKLELLMKKLC